MNQIKWIFGWLFWDGFLNGVGADLRMLHLGSLVGARDGTGDNTAAIDIIGGSTGALNNGARFEPSGKWGIHFDGTNSTVTINWINPALNLRLSRWRHG